MNDLHRMLPRAELSRFLRSRRARVQPADVGLPDGARRRTPGLRREELARLAEVGVSWYTWLEQGREINVSEPLLERLAQALRLSPAERAHLFELAQGRPPARPALAPTAVPEALQRVLDAHPYPGLVSNGRRDILAWNRPAVVLYGDFALQTPRERNGLWSYFMQADRRARMPDWESDARRAVAGFRRDAGRAADRTPFDELVRDLSAVSPEFARFWREHDVFDTPEGTKVILEPELGPIEFQHVALAHTDTDGHELRVTLYAPLPGTSTERAHALFRRGS